METRSEVFDLVENQRGCIRQFGFPVLIDLKRDTFRERSSVSGCDRTPVFPFKQTVVWDFLNNELGDIRADASELFGNASEIVDQ